MRINFLSSAATALLCLANVATADPAKPQSPAAPTQTQEEQAQKMHASEEPQENLNQGFAGLDFYAGRSNVEDARRFSHGFWAGSAPVYPGTFYLRWTMRKGAEAKLAIGTGDLYRSKNSALHQPHEAWYQTPRGSAKIMVGKFYVPFAVQEWEYETKWGAMAQKSIGATDLTASLNLDQATHRPNLYARAGRSLNSKINVGVSAALGRGISYGSVHDKALGADLTAGWRGFELLGEYVTFRSRASDRFSFAFAKISYDGLGKLQPFVARYRWNDKSDTFGNFRSSVIGLNYQILPTLSLETAYADTGERNVSWIQIHWTPEFKFYEAVLEVYFRCHAERSRGVFCEATTRFLHYAALILRCASVEMTLLNDFQNSFYEERKDSPTARRNQLSPFLAARRGHRKF